MRNPLAPRVCALRDAARSFSGFGAENMLEATAIWCRLPQASPHFPRDIKESSGRRAIPKRILGLAQLVDPCEVVGAIPRSRLTSESASRHRFGSYYGHPGALLVQGNSRRS